MSATNHTQNYDLSQFVGGDIPSWLGDYNGDMSKIDAAIAEVASGAGDIASNVNSLKSRMTTAEADIDAAESNIATLQTTEATQGAAITQNTNNITTANNNISALDVRVTALEQASGSGLDLTAFTGSATVTSSAGTIDVASTDVKYALNADKSIAKVFGGIYASSVSLSTGWTEVADIEIPDLTAIANAFTVPAGFSCGRTSGGAAFPTIRYQFKANGHIGIEMYSSAPATLNDYFVTLQPCIYLLSQGV